MKTYTTRFNTIISPRILSDLMESIRAGEDTQDSITDHLRDVIPQHDEDFEEAMEVYNHVEQLIYDEEDLLDLD